MCMEIEQSQTFIIKWKKMQSILHNNPTLVRKL